MTSARGYRIAGESVTDAVGAEFGLLVAERDRLRDQVSAANMLAGQTVATGPNWQALGRSALEAAQEVIGQCDCIMAETSENDPKRLWREARDAFLSASRMNTRRTEP